MPIPSRYLADAVVLAPRGRVDFENCESFGADLAPHVAHCTRDGGSVVLDLSGVDYVSSAGLRCFMLAAKQARTQHGRIAVAALQPVVAEIFQISRFNLVFEIYPTVREALAAVSPEAAAALDQA